MIAVLLLVIFSGIAVFVITQMPKFGKLPKGERLEKINRSPHYYNGVFHNLHPTPVMIKGTSFYKVFKDFLFIKNKPIDRIPSIKTDLFKLEKEKDVLIWFGHSSYIIQMDGIKILVDPVLSGHASPFSFITKAFNGSDPFTTDDIPEIDYLIITHDHWDHLDYETIIKLKPKIRHIICSLGTASHLEYWGYNTSVINEMDWKEKITFENGLTIHAVPARHFSGRSFTRNKSFWCAFVVQTTTFQLFIGGDGGYDTHFAEIGKDFGEFDLVILENGQYNSNWKYIHMQPEEVLQAAKDLKAKSLLPVHSSKFALSIHPWDEPLKRITALNKNTNLKILTPIIGEKVNLKDQYQKFSQWWIAIR